MLPRLVLSEMLSATAQNRAAGYRHTAAHRQVAANRQITDPAARVHSGEDTAYCSGDHLDASDVVAPAVQAALAGKRGPFAGENNFLLQADTVIRVLRHVAQQLLVGDAAGELLRAVPLGESFRAAAACRVVGKNSLITPGGQLIVGRAVKSQRLGRNRKVLWIAAIRLEATTAPFFSSGKVSAPPAPPFQRSL